MPPKKRRLMLLGGPGGKGADDETCATFVFEGESHTLGKFSFEGMEFQTLFKFLSNFGLEH